MIIVCDFSPRQVDLRLRFEVHQEELIHCLIYVIECDGRGGIIVLLLPAMKLHNSK